jgi:uncharacterized protein
MRIGIIADTHGFFDPRAERHFAGVEHIIHAGDIGAASVLERLEAIAPVTAVTGNVDWGGPLDRVYRRTERLERVGFRIYVTHIGDHPRKLAERLPDPRPQVFIYGHSHIAVVEEREGVLFLNPGAAGKPRFGRPVTVAILELGERAQARIVPL